MKIGHCCEDWTRAEGLEEALRAAELMLRLLPTRDQYEVKALQDTLTQVRAALAERRSG
jgi:hypothetical protein